MSAKRILLAVFAILLISGCTSREQTDKAVLLTMQDVYTIDSDGGTLVIPIVTNRKFIVRTSCDWLTWIPDSKSVAREYITLEVKENGTDTERSATATIVTPDDQKTITVVQAGYSEPDELEVTADSLDVDEYGGEIHIGITSNHGFDAFLEAGTDWISLEDNSDGCTVNVSPNTTATRREARILVIAGNAKQYITVSQSASQVQEFQLGYGYAGTSVNVAVFRAASIVSDAKWQFTAWYDDAGVINIARRQLNPDGEWETHATTLKGAVADAHNTISLGMDGNGYIHVSWNQHGTRLRYARSKAPYSWEFDILDEMIDAAIEKNVTYPEFRRFSNGDLLFAYRDGISGSGNLVLNRYDVSQCKWSRIQDNLLSGEGSRNAYWQMYMGSDDAIYLSWVWRETPDVATNHDLCYALSRDGGLTWQKSDGTPYPLPITTANAEIAWPVPQKSEMINQTSMTVDKNGHPYIATYWRAQGESVPQYRIVYNDGTEWKQSQVGNRITAFSLSGGGTKAIPISRPQIVSDGEQTLVLFRDIDRGSRISVAGSSDLNYWGIRDLTADSVDAWEPSFDYERWNREHVLDIFVQRAGQGDGEQSTQLQPQPVRVLELK